MCMIDDAEPCEFYRETRPKARKAHRCSSCHRDILPGETYRLQVGKWDGIMDTCKECAHCEAAGEWLIERCNGYPIGMMLEDLCSHWDEEGVREWRLGRLIVSAQRQWKRRDGTLVPVEEIQAVTDRAEAA